MAGVPDRVRDRRLLATGTATRASQYAGAVATYRAQTDASPPSTPPALTAGVPTTSSIPLTWGASTDDVGVTGYRVEKGGALAGTTTSTGYTATGLACGTSYSVRGERLRRRGERLQRRRRSTASTAPCDAAPPSTPPGLTAGVATTTSIPLTWGPSTDDVGVTGYRVAKDETTLGTTTQTGYTVTGLTCGTSYTLAVSALDAIGNASTPATITATTAACDVTPPSTPAPGVTGSSTTSISIAWMTSLDDVGVLGYSLYQDGVAAGSTTSTAFTFSGLACGTTHTLAVDAVDAAGNRSAQGSVTWDTTACDTVAPTVAITAPADTSTVGGSVTVTADAADDVALASVQLRLDGAALGAPLTAPPYSTAWNTALIANGQHVLSAVATDSSGNTATSAPVTVTVANTAPATPTPVPAADTAGVTVGDGLAESSTRRSSARRATSSTRSSPTTIRVRARPPATASSTPTAGPAPRPRTAPSRPPSPRPTPPTGPSRAAPATAPTRRARCCRARTCGWTPAASRT